MAIVTSIFKLEDTVFQVSKEAEVIVPKIPLMNNELNILSEAILCILSSQDKYEIAMSACKKLRDLIFIPKTRKEVERLKLLVMKTLSQNFSFCINGKTYSRKIRFNRKKAEYIMSTIDNIYLNNLTISKIIEQAASYDCARKRIIESCCGLGPKQASMFLRNIGYHSEFAVLDKHIIDYMKLLGLLKVSGYNNLTSYKRIEMQLKSYAADRNVSLLHLDLAIWTTMRVFKNY